MRTLFTLPALVAAVLSLACDTDGSPAAPEPNRMEANIILVEKALLDEEIELIDENKDGLVCVKPTPSDHLVLKDASSNPSQPCPPSFEHKGKGSTVEWQKEWFSEDANGNGVVCAKQTGNGSWIVKDDNLATPSQPCPPAFYLVGEVTSPKVPSKDLAAADHNGNGVVCLKVADGTGNFLIRDDNEATPSQPCPPAFSVEPTGEGSR